ncbi:radical SAM protein [Sedimentibacter sp. zth1]|uniref:coproporphyrinogen-III oxidase family protein n=1 Tax=Sedimentibacter sp. zth1 TaxID=2816908 RepID=UPI001A9244AB|nr:radical SAM protein [Sedimentibacter sp. zth1]QSX05717.1 radical SAM protein [Sedimentibacter sp. zth1]
MSILTTVTRMWLTRSVKPFLFTNEFDNQLPYMETNQLGLYVHIPFCKTICTFCPYCKVKYDVDLANRYTDALIKEIHHVGSANEDKKIVTSLYFGGGSPALVEDRLGEIISAINQYFTIAEGIGIELHPNNVTIKLLEKLKQVGITKISIGIQSFQDEFLKTLGREKIDYQSMIYAIQSVPFETVSMDFIFALPGQTFELLKRDINTAFQNGANHIAIYPFIDFAFTDSTILKMSNKEKRKLLDDITNYFNEKGYVRDSIWTFSSSKGKKYSSMTRDNFLGFGCSATTLLEKQFKINTFSIDDYIKRINNNKLPTSLTIRFTKRQRMMYYLFWTAYTTRISSEDFEKFFGVSLKSQYCFELWVAKCLGYITEQDGLYEMTLKGAFYYHYYENYYTLSYIDKMWGIMKNEAFPPSIKF